MKTIIAILLLSAHVFAAEFGFEVLANHAVSLKIKTASRTFFFERGYVENKKINIFDVRCAAIAEVNGGNITPTDLGGATTPDNPFYARPSTLFCVWWLDYKIDTATNTIVGATLTFNATSKPMDTEIQAALIAFEAWLPVNLKPAVNAPTFKRIQSGTF